MKTQSIATNTKINRKKMKHKIKREKRSDFKTKCFNKCQVIIIIFKKQYKKTIPYFRIKFNFFKLSNDKNKKKTKTDKEYILIITLIF